MIVATGADHEPFQQGPKRQNVASKHSETQCSDRLGHSDTTYRGTAIDESQSSGQLKARDTHTLHWAPIANCIVRGGCAASQGNLLEACPNLPCTRARRIGAWGRLSRDNSGEQCGHVRASRTLHCPPEPRPVGNGDGDKLRWPGFTGVAGPVS